MVDKIMITKVMNAPQYERICLMYVYCVVDGDGRLCCVYADKYTAEDYCRDIAQINETCNYHVEQYIVDQS